MLGSNLRLRGGLSVACALTAGATVVMSPASARAHFTLNTPACWENQDGTGFPQKNGPCAATPSAGEPNVTPVLTHMVTAYQTGQAVTVKITATIPHTGWFRIALAEGASASQTTTSLPDPPGTSCTPTKLTNPVWSPTQPVLADGLLTPTATGQSETYQVTLPANAICTKATPCTLQVIMVMTDHTFPTCYYHHCADIEVTSLDGGGSASGTGSDASAAADSSQASSDASTSGTGTTGTSGTGTSGMGTTGMGTTGMGTTGMGTTGTGTTGAGTSGTGTTGAGTSGTGASGTGTTGAGASGTGATGSGTGGASTTGPSGSGTTTSGNGGSASGGTEDGGAGGSNKDNGSAGCGIGAGGGYPAGIAGLGFLAFAMARRRRRS